MIGDLGLKFRGSGLGTNLGVISIQKVNEATGEADSVCRARREGNLKVTMRNSKILQPGKGKQTCKRMAKC